MAEFPPPVTVVDKGLNDLKREFTCAVCHDVFKEPKILPCCHYYCKDCIQGLIDYAGRANRPFECPECRVPTTVPQNDPNQLTTAFFVNRLKELHGKMEKAHGKVEATCEQCNRDVSVAFCRQCTEFICEKCVEPHQRMKVFSGHKVVSLEELKKGGAKQILVSKPPPPKCPIHDGKMKAFCFDCNQLICRDCIVIDHAGHMCEFARKAAPQVKQELVEHLAPLKEVQENLVKAAEVVQVTKSEVMAQGASVAENIEQSFQELHEILEQHKNSLLAEASDTVEKKVAELSTQEKGLNMASGSIQSLVDFVEQNLKNATDEELMTIHKQILSRINKEVEECCKGLKPVVIADLNVEVSCAKKIHQACQTFAELYQLADPSECKLHGSGLNKAEVNQQTHVIVTTMLPNGTPTKKPQKVTAELKSLVNESVTRLEGVRKEGNTYEIQFSSAVRGRHQLTVNVNDQPIAGSPFPVFVKIPPTQLGKPVRVISEFREPYGVAINSAEEVLVTDREKIVVLDKKGRKLREIRMPDEDISLNGIAIDEDSNIYVTDFSQYCLMKYNKDGDVLKIIDTPEDEYEKKDDDDSEDKNGYDCDTAEYEDDDDDDDDYNPAEDDYDYDCDDDDDFYEIYDPRGVAVIGDKVFVCERENHRLQVFTKDTLEFVETIGSQGKGDEQLNEPKDIAQDNLGNMYVCDSGTDPVKLLNKQGEFQLAFNKKGNNQLRNPFGVCVAGQFVYVVERGGCCVSVFSRDGPFVTSFGKEGKKEGEFCGPIGVCVDYDGFVYVCDRDNKRVQVF